MPLMGAGSNLTGIVFMTGPVRFVFENVGGIEKLVKC